MGLQTNDKFCHIKLSIKFSPISAVPTFDLEGVQPSEVVINTTVVTPATVSFNITDDDVAFEVDEIYTVTIIPEDGTVTVGTGTATIIITDNIDSKSCWLMHKH